MTRSTFVPLSLLFLIPVALAIPAIAQDEFVSEEDREACRTALNLSVEMAKIGTYAYRIDECAGMRAKARNDSGRRDRLMDRAIFTQERISRNSKIAVHREIGTPETTYEQGIRFRTALRETANAREQATRDYSRPSRRNLQKEADQQSKASKFDSAALYRERILQAIHTCEAIDNRFHRANCVRTTLEKLMNTPPPAAE